MQKYPKSCFPSCFFNFNVKPGDAGRYPPREQYYRYINTPIISWCSAMRVRVLIMQIIILICVKNEVTWSTIMQD